MKIIMPTLYLVATPIGNLEDITLRALRILREVKLIAAEDTRKTRQLLQAYSIKTRVTSYHEQGKGSGKEKVLRFLQNNDVALVSEAGTPGLSDPGYDLVTAAVQAGIRIVPIPGPSAIVASLTVSALPNAQFLYVGFLPRGKGARQRLLHALVLEPRTIIALEAPHRLKSALEDLLAVLGERRVALCRELTKVHEEVFRGTLSQAIEHFTKPRGEFTLVIEGKDGTGKDKTTLKTGTLQELRHLHRQSMTAKKAISQVAKGSGLSRRELYRTWLSLIT